METKKLNDSNAIPLIIICIYLSAILFIPFKIISYGYMPLDDALGRAAKVISGKNWDQILVLKDNIGMEVHPGWNSILTAFHQLTNCSIDVLVVFSVISLFILFFLVPLIFLKRPEAWLFALMVPLLTEPIFLIRLTNGRPLIFTMAALIFILFAWNKFKEKPSLILYLSTTLIIAAATWIHSSWYLFLLFIASLLLAREWKAAVRIGICFIAGVLLGALLTMHPVTFISQVVGHCIDVFNGTSRERILVGELAADTGNVLMLMAIAIMLGWRALRNKWDTRILDNPVFILGILGWILGFVAFRFWVDWGLPALIVWMALEFNSALEEKIGYSSWKRIVVTGVAAVTLFLMITSDSNSRWSFNSDKGYVTQKETIEASWLPEPNGILYSADMRVFFRTFYKNPHEQWRYILGFEPTMMPKVDLEIYRNILFSFGSTQAYEPWVKKMTPLDRLAVISSANTPPLIPGLEWYHATSDLWLGKTLLEDK